MLRQQLWDAIRKSNGLPPRKPPGLRKKAAIWR
jgi:hypothetical protein